MGFFSWKTQDTDKSIANKYSDRDTFTVYMVNPITGKYYQENNYAGYGIFGGKDFYELLAEINNKKNREEGIELAFSGKNYISPILVEKIKNWEKYKDLAPLTCVAQGYFYENETLESGPTNE